jgi:hypothetical protein
MELIWQNQNPEDCRKARYLIVEPWQAGFGSEYHVYTVGLGIALQLNRVLLVRDDVTRWQYNLDFCKSQKLRTMECYYLPWSKCTLEDAYHSQQHAMNRPTTVTYEVQEREWKSEETKELFQIVTSKAYQRDWMDIGKHFRRTPVQCYRHWNEAILWELQQNNKSSLVSLKMICFFSALIVDYNKGKSKFNQSSRYSRDGTRDYQFHSLRAWCDRSLLPSE